MNLRILINVLLAVACLAEVAGILARHRQYTQLRDKQQQCLNSLAALSAGDSTAPAPAASTEVAPTDASVPPELLRLRSEATRLRLRKRELANVTSEAERLRAQLEAKARNPSAAGTAETISSPGFIRKSDARNVGANSPDDTIQTALWAIQNRDTTNLLALFSPEAAEKLQKTIDTAPDFFKDVEDLVGMSILGREQLAPDVIDLSLGIQTDHDEHTEHTRFRLIQGQWRIDDPQ